MAKSRSEKETDNDLSLSSIVGRTVRDLHSWYGLRPKGVRRSVSAALLLGVCAASFGLGRWPSTVHPAPDQSTAAEHAAEERESRLSPLDRRGEFISEDRREERQRSEAALQPFERQNSAPPTSRIAPELANASLLETACPSVRDLPQAGTLDDKVGLAIYVFDVGQADSMLIVGPPPERRSLLVDIGEVNWNASGFRRVAEHVKSILGGVHIDYFMVSHFHADHVGSGKNGIAGLLALPEHFTIDTVIDIGNEGQDYIPAERTTLDAFENTMKGARREGSVAKRVRPQFGSSQIRLGTNAKVEILGFAGRVSPTDKGALAEVEKAEPGHYEHAPASENDLSIAMLVRFGEFEFFTAGDLTGGEEEDQAYSVRSFPKGKRQTYTNVEQRMTQYWIDTNRECDVEVYRVNHHGSSHSTTQRLLNLLDPEFMIYSCGSNKYDHPSRSVVERGAQTARQFVTRSLSKKSWPNPTEFTNFRGEIVGDVEILIDRAGSWYRINGELHKAYTDAEEECNQVGPRGRDVGEEDRRWGADQEGEEEED